MLHPVHWLYVGTLSQTRVAIGQRAGRYDFRCRTASSGGDGIRGGGRRTRSGQRPCSARTADRSLGVAPKYPFPKKLGRSGAHCSQFPCRVSTYIPQSWVIRMPNFVKVDSKPFHPDTYVGPDQEDEELVGAENSRESSMSIKLKVENTLRWRWVKDEDGNYVSLPLPHQFSLAHGFSIGDISNANLIAVSSVGLMDRSVFSWEKSYLTFPSNYIHLSSTLVQLSTEPNHPNPRQNPHSSRSRRQPKTRVLPILLLNTNVRKFFKAKLSLPVICNCDPLECRARLTECWSVLLDRSTTRLPG